MREPQHKLFVHGLTALNKAGMSQQSYALTFVVTGIFTVLCQLAAEARKHFETFGKVLAVKPMPRGGNVRRKRIFG